MAQKFIGITLPIRLGPTGMFEQSVTTLQQVKSNFKNLILTKKGERVYQTELGCDLWRILFETLSPDTLENARIAVISAIDRWIPFIELTDLQIATDNQNSIIGIKCVYRFRGNPNVTDELTISGRELGLPAVGTTPLFNKSAQQMSSLTNARRIRRL